MFRNQYDGDNTTWSPQGRIHQVEYAMEAVKQGSCTVGLRSDTHAIVIALKRNFSMLITAAHSVCVIEWKAASNPRALGNAVNKKKKNFLA